MSRSRCLLFCVFVAAAASVPIRAQSGMQDRSAVEVEEAEMRSSVTAADCSFSVAPHRFLQAASGHRAAVSKKTVDVAAKVGGRVLAVTAHVPPSGSPRVAIQRQNFIDDYIFKKIRDDQIPFSNLAGDEEFLRRVTIDLTGRIPSPNDVRQFLADDSTTKRKQRIDSLLHSDAFVDRWTMFYGDLLRNNAFSGNVIRYPEGRNAFYNYIKESVRSNKPYDLMAREIIGATGDSWVNGAANFIVGGRTPMGPPQDTYDTLAVQTATIFLGINSFDCLFCHNGAGHLDNLSYWGQRATRMDAWRMASFFARSTARRELVSEQPTRYKYFVADRQAGEYQLNTTAGNRTPRIADNGVAFVTPEYIFSGSAPSARDYRGGLAFLLTADIQFARAAVNYLWAEMMGIGLVDPPDSFDLARLDPKNPPPAPWKIQPSHPELLEALAEEFVRSNYDLRHMLGLIAASSAYQLSSRSNGEWSEEYTAYFARKFVRRLDAEEIHDAIASATGIVPNLGVSGFDAPVQWAMQLPDTGEPRGRRDRASFEMLEVFLRGDRDQVDRSSEGSILQALTLMNSAFVNSRIHRNNFGSLVSRLIQQNLGDDAVVEELYLATLSRFPSAGEKDMAVKTLAAAADRNRAIEDLQWVLINKVDFIYNY